MDSTLFSLSRRRNARGLVRGLCAFASLSVGVAAFAASEPSFVTGQKKNYAYSWQQEVELGAQADKEVVEEMGLYDNPDLQAYVDALGQRLVQASAFTGPNAPEIYRNTHFTFRVIDSTVVNAFALPGGYVYVTRGLLAHVDNEAQLAVVLGHEIGHVVARHSSQQAKRDQWGQIGVVLGSILGQKVLGEKMPDIGEQIMNYGGKATETFLLRYSREAESESDSLGVTYATRAGYAAAESARFFEALQRISAADGKRLPTWASTHPDPGDRARRVVQLAQQTRLPNGQAVVGTEEYLRHVDGLVVGEDPREGFAQNGIFYHPTLQFEMPAPSGWQLDNQKAAVIFAEPNNRAMLGLKLAEGSRARDAASQFVQKTGLQIVANGDTNVNGLPASVIIGLKDSDQGKIEVWNAFIEMDNRVFSLLGYAPQQSFEQFRGTFESVAAGFAPLRNSSVAIAQPAVIRVVRADRAGPFASFIPTALPQNLSAESLAIMNQVDMNQQVPAGALLKVPETAAANTANVTAPQYRSRYPDYRNNRNDQDPYRGDYGNRPAANYPDNSRYPNPSSRYPDQNQNQNRYPQSSYPSQQNYPNSNYPNRDYPPANSGYPNYPNQNYPQSGYGYPQSSGPQFPQPPGATSNPRAQPTQPAWPR